MIYAIPNSKVTAVVEGFDPDLEHVGIKVMDGDGGTVVARTEADIVELAPGLYATDSLQSPSKVATYIVVWDDGGTGIATEELRVSYTAPAEVVPPEGGVDVALARKRSALLAKRFPEGTEEVLQELLNVAAGLVSELTGRLIPPAETGEAVPIGMWPLAVQAVIMEAEVIAPLLGTAEDREDSIDRSRLRSIAAGSWSESYFGPGEAAKNKQLADDPILAQLLWALATEEKRAEWLEQWDSGHQRGFSMIESFDYSRRPSGY